MNKAVNLLCGTPRPAPPPLSLRKRPRASLDLSRCGL
jgi:hypothetical protein